MKHEIITIRYRTTKKEKAALLSCARQWGYKSISGLFKGTLKAKLGKDFFKNLK